MARLIAAETYLKYAKPSLPAILLRNEVDRRASKTSI